MQLNQLPAGGALGFAARWRTMWNTEILPYLRSARLVAGRGIRLDQRPGGTVISVTGGGSRGGGSSGYSGGFKLIDAREFSSGGVVTKYAVKVINGADPDSEYCGQTDLGDSYPGSLTEVETATLEGVSGMACLAARWNSETEKYECAVTAETAGWTAWQVLGSWYFGDGAGTVSQYWQGGEIIYFGERFYI